MSFDVGIRGMSPRELVQRCVWKASEDGKRFEIAYDSIDHAAFPPDKNFVRAKATMLWCFETLEPTNRIPQTMVSYTVKLRWGGLVSRRYIKGKAQNIMSFVGFMRQVFDRKAEIDEVDRRNFIEIYNRGGGKDISSYSAEEKVSSSSGEERKKNSMSTRLLAAYTSLLAESDIGGSELLPHLPKQPD